MVACIARLYFTYWSQNKNADIIQTIFTNDFSSLKSCEFQLNFSEVYSWGSNWHQISIGFGYGFVWNLPQAIAWTNDYIGKWCILCNIGTESSDLVINVDTLMWSMSYSCLILWFMCFHFIQYD